MALLMLHGCTLPAAACAAAAAAGVLLGAVPAGGDTQGAQLLAAACMHVELAVLASCTASSTCANAFSAAYEQEALGSNCAACHLAHSSVHDITHNHNACGHASAFSCRHSCSLLQLPLPCLPLHARGQGYDGYIAVFYAVSAVILVSLALTVWVAVILKKDDSGNAWLRR